MGFLVSIPDLEKFELQGRWFRLLRLRSIEEFDVLELLVRDAQHPHLSRIRKDSLHSLHVYFHIFAAGTVSHVDGELEHGETILYETLSEVGIHPSVFLGFGG